MIKNNQSDFIRKSLSLLALAVLPLSVSAMSIYPGYYNWPSIAIASLLGFLIAILVWLISPMGVIFTICSLAQFLLPRKPVKIVAWIFQGLTLISTILIGGIGIVYAMSQYGEQKYIFLFSILGAFSVILLGMISAMITQIIWQRKKSK